MKTQYKWALGILVIALVGVGAARWYKGNQAKQETLRQQQTTQLIQPTVVLSPEDVFELQLEAVALGIPVSGQVKAANSAVLKARVSGELQDLSLREGDHVARGQILARIETTDYTSRLRQAQQQAEAAKTQVDIAKRSFDNNRSLVEQGFISKTALESSNSTFAGAQATYQAATAAVDLAQKALEDTQLRAPISGQISQRFAQTGERVAVDAKVLEVVDLTRMELEATLSGAESMQVRVGQTAKVTLEGAADAYTARLIRINPSLTAGSRAVTVYFGLDTQASKGALRQGLYAQGIITLGGVKTLAVPLSALRTDKPKPYLQVIRGGKIVHQEVDLGERGQVNGGDFVGISGLASGSQVVAGSAGLLAEGTLVSVGK